MPERFKVNNMAKYSIQDIAKKPIDFVTYYDGHYYVHLAEDRGFNNVIWKVSDTNGTAEKTFYTQYLISVADHARDIPVKSFKMLGNK